MLREINTGTVPCHQNYIIAKIDIFKRGSIIERLITNFLEVSKVVELTILLQTQRIL